MQIKKTSNKRFIFTLVLSLITIVLFGFLGSSLLNKNTAKSKKEIPGKVDDATQINLTSFDFEELILSDQGHLFKNDDLHVFAIEENNTPKIAFIYHEEVSGRKEKDRFFIHLFLKDSTKLKEPYFNISYLNTTPPEIINVDGNDHYVFKRALISQKFKDGIIPFSEIEYINVGRYDPKEGRSLSANNLIATQEIIKKRLSKIKARDITSNLQLATINVYAKEEKFKKIRSKRKEALKSGVLLSAANDPIDGSIQLVGEEKLKTEFRLKGDWTDHLNREKQWSYRFILKDQKTILGMRKFSLQHPRTRNFHWEWLINKLVKDEEIIGLRYDFVYFNQYIKNENSIEHINNNIMALEESFDKILIENNKKREGVVIAFDESMFWNDHQYEGSLGFERNTHRAPSTSVQNAKIKVYNEGKVLSDPKLKKQFLVAKDLLDGLRLGKYTVSEVFDLDKLATYTALCNLLGGHHGLVWHNLRIYYNPITNKLEPISFDSNSGTKIKGIKHYPFAKKDPIYLEKLAEKLELVSSQEYINLFLKKHGPELNRLTEIMNESYPHFNFDIKILEYNSNLIKKIVYSRDIVTGDLINFSKNTLTLEVNNMTHFPVSINGLAHIDGKRLNNANDDPLNLAPLEKRLVRFNLKKAFDNAFVSKKNKKGGFQYPKDVDKLRILAQIKGVALTKGYTVGAYGRNQELDTTILAYQNAHRTNYTDFEFVQQGNDSTQITFPKGNFTLSQTIKIPENLVITISPGFQLDLTNNASIISKATVIANGTKEEPIVFNSGDKTGGGIFVDSASKKSILNYCVFDNLSNPNNALWEVSGAVNFHESEVTISNSVFKNNRCEDALNIIRSNFTMIDTEFHNTYSDSFDGDFVTGEITNCKFYNAGNDGIDVSGSNLRLQNILIENPSDKGISAGEASTISGSDIKVERGEIGIVSKDLSNITLNNVQITDTRLGFSAFQKKSEYGKATINISQLTQLNNESDYLIETGCKLAINDELMPTVSNKVIDQMYGGEYGKSSN